MARRKAWIFRHPTGPTKDDKGPILDIERHVEERLRRAVELVDLAQV